MYEEILKQIAETYNSAEQAVLNHAFYFAKSAHTGQKRASGEEYFTHPVAVAKILIDLGMDYNTVAAAFLHDVVEDTPVSESDIKAEFGDEILELVAGVTKLDKIEFKSQEEEQAENFKKIFVSMAKDIRVLSLGWRTGCITCARLIFYRMNASFVWLMKLSIFMLRSQADSVYRKSSVNSRIYV